MKKIAFILLISFLAVDSFAQKKEKKSEKDTVLNTLILKNTIQKKEKKSKKELKAEAEAAKNKVLLRYNLKQGEGYEQIMENDMKMQIMGMDIPMLQKISTKNTITDVDASGNLTQEVIIDKFYLKQSNPMTGDLEYDSEDPKKQAPELAGQLGSMKGTKSSIKMTSTGKVLEAPKEADMSNSSNQYPEQAVGVGDTWELSSISKNPMMGNKEITSQNQYKLIERSAGKATVEVNSKMVSEGKDIGSISGKIIIDEKTGIVLEGDMFQKMEMEVQGMESKVETKIKIIGKKL